jgi:transposase
MACDEKHMAIDLSHIFSDSQTIPWLEFGHNGDDVWRPQVGIMLMWGTTTQRPGFLKLLPGATHSAQTIVNAIRESDLQDIIMVMDKGFWSLDNMNCLEAANLHYAMALKRDLSCIKHVPQSQYTEYFRYRKRAQWWRSTEWEGRVIYHFLDKSIADQEESTYLELIEERKATMTDYKRLKNRFGTLSILTDTGLSAEETYALYKERRDVEYAFDTLQNTLDGDVTWMQSRESLQGYLFIFFIALHLYSQVLEHLKRKDLLKQYSVQDVLTYLSKVCIVEVDGEDRLGEITKQTQKVIDLLESPITKTLGF